MRTGHTHCRGDCRGDSEFVTAIRRIIRAVSGMIGNFLDACREVLEINGDPQSAYWLTSQMMEMRMWRARPQLARIDILGFGHVRRAATFNGRRPSASNCDSPAGQPVAVYPDGGFVSRQAVSPDFWSGNRCLHVGARCEPSLFPPERDSKLTPTTAIGAPTMATVPASNVPGDCDD